MTNVGHPATKAEASVSAPSFAIGDQVCLSGLKTPKYNGKMELSSPSHKLPQNDTAFYLTA